MKNLFKVVILSLVIFTLSATLVSAFSDISDADADFLVSKGVLTGYEDGTFRPNAPITRAEFSTVMCRALNLVDYARSLVTEQRFTDVPTSHWACGYVNALASKGIISGVGDGNFDPDNTVTYAQVSKIIAGALGYTQEDADHYGGFPRGWQKIAERVGFAVETEDINGPISRIGVVRALSRSDIVYKEPKIVATIDDIKNGDASFLATVEKLDIGMYTGDFPINWYKLGFDNLKEITCSPDNPAYCVVDGVLYNYRKDHLIKYPAARPGKSYTIPTGVWGICPGSFYHCKYLTELDLGPDPRMINQDAFSGCKFRTISIPLYMSQIDDGAFTNCKYLEEIYMSSERLGGINDDIFAGGNKNLRIYSNLDPYDSVFEFASKYGYVLNDKALEYMPENYKKIYIGISYDDAKNTLSEFGVYHTANNGKWAVYGSYKDFTAVYFSEDKATFAFTTDMSQYNMESSPFVDHVGGIDWGIGMGTLPIMVPDEANEVMISHFVNAYRAVYDLPPLTYDSDLADIARYHSENMSKAKILDHDLNGESPSDRLVKFRYNYSGYAENIAQNPYNITTAVAGWIDSEGHRQNFLTKSLSKTGVGISKENRFFTWMAANGAKMEEIEPEEPDTPETVVKSGLSDADRAKLATGDRVADGTYVIATKLDPVYALDISDGSTKIGANLQLYHRNNTAAQSFEVTYIGDGYYTIINTNSGKAIDAEWGNTQPGTNVWQYTVNNTDAQIWKIVPAVDDSYYIINKASDLYLDVNLALATDFNNIKLYVQNEAYEAQKWYFIKQ